MSLRWQTVKLTVNSVICFDDAQPTASSLIWRVNWGQELLPQHTHSCNVDQMNPTVCRFASNGGRYALMVKSPEMITQATIKCTQVTAWNSISTLHSFILIPISHHFFSSLCNPIISKSINEKQVVMKATYRERFSSTNINISTNLS